MDTGRFIRVTGRDHSYKFDTKTGKDVNSPRSGPIVYDLGHTDSRYGGKRRYLMGPINHERPDRDHEDNLLYAVVTPNLRTGLGRDVISKAELIAANKDWRGVDFEKLLVERICAVEGWARLTEHAGTAALEVPAARATAEIRARFHLANKDNLDATATLESFMSCFEDDAGRDYSKEQDFTVSLIREVMDLIDPKMKIDNNVIKAALKERVGSDLAEGLVEMDAWKANVAGIVDAGTPTEEDDTMPKESEQQGESASVLCEMEWRLDREDEMLVGPPQQPLPNVSGL